MMKRLIALLLALLLPACALAEVAQEATALPLSMNFGMDYAAVLSALGEGVEQDDWGDETGYLMMGACDIGMGGLKAESASCQVDRNNSAGASRLSQLSFTLSTEGGCIASFRAVLAALQQVYGAPDGDPFDEGGVESYVEYGNLSATWTKADVRISLYMSRMYAESLTLDFSNRLCYDKADLQ